MTHATARRFAALLAATLLVPPASCGQADPPHPAGQPGGAVADPAFVDAPGLRFDAPSAWQRSAPGGMRIAEFTAKPPDDMEKFDTASIVFFYFGPQGAGDVQANIDRWASLVLDKDGAPAVPEIKSQEIEGLKVTTATLHGVYLSGPPQGEKTPKPGYTLVGAIVEGGAQGPVFIRMTGPVEVVESHEMVWDRMIASVRKAE